MKAATRFPPHFFGDALEHLAEGFALFGGDGALLVANRRFAEMLDAAPGVLAPGRQMRDLLEGVLSDEITGPGLPPILQAVKRRESRAVAIELQDGRRRTLRLHPLDDGSVTVTVVDVTDSVPNALGRHVVGDGCETSFAGRSVPGKDVTAQLRAERLFTDAVARLPVGIAIEGPDGTFSHCNDAFAAPFGLSATQMLTMSDEARIVSLAPEIATIAGEDVGSDSAAVFARAIRRQRETLEPMEVRFRNGRHFLVERAVTENGGRVVVVTETTALKDAQNASLRTLYDTIQSLDEGLAMFDRAGTFVLGNRMWDDLFRDGVAPPASGETLDAIIHRLVASGTVVAPDGMPAADHAEALLNAVRRFEKKRVVHLRDGAILQVSAHRTRAEGSLVSFMDVTEQRRAEEEQREADLLLRKIVDACPANFLVSRVDDGKIIYCPPPSRERFGEIESTLSFFLKPDDRQRYLDALLPTGSLDDYRVQFRRADGSIMQGLTAARVTEYKGEQVIVSSTRDISELLAMQEELQRQRDKAHQAEKLSALGELLAGVAHELNNPLSIIVGYAQMLEGKLSDPVLARRVDRIAEAANRSARIVHTFLAMARRRPATLATCSLNDIVETALDVAGYGLRATGARIEVDLDRTLPPVRCDEDQMVQVFANLIVNAEHALSGRSDAGVLFVRSFFDASRHQIVVEVRDNGPGIPEHLQARIFEPFFTTKDVGAGTGVGLAFANRIVAAHGGRLDVESEMGSGTSFFVGLDCGATDAPGHDDAGDQGPPRAGKRVLVVDDEPALGELIRDLLQDLGCRPVVTTDACDALALLETESFDCIVSDFKMPGMNGEAFYNAILEKRPDYATRLGYITGDSMSRTVLRFMSESGRPHIEKPLSRKDLAELLERLTGERADPR